MESTYPPWLQAYKHRSSAFSYPTREEKSDTAMPPKERQDDENTYIKSNQAAISDPARDCVFPSMISLSLYDVSSLAKSASETAPNPTSTPTQERQTQPLNDEPASDTPSSDYTDLKPNQTSKSDHFESPVRHRERFKQRLIRFLSCGRDWES